MKWKRSEFESYTIKKELGNEAALKQIKQENKYPKIIDFDIYCSDPEAAKKVLDAGLEIAGLVTVKPLTEIVKIYLIIEFGIVT